MASAGGVHPIRSSLPYQILLFLNGWYTALFFLLECAMFIYKGRTFPYPAGVLAAEIILLFLLAILDAIRIFFGQKGNLSERVIPVVVSLVLSVPSVFAAVYILIWQTYVLRAEVVLSAIELAFIAFELIFGIISCITFARAAPY